MNFNKKKILIYKKQYEKKTYEFKIKLWIQKPLKIKKKKPINLKKNILIYIYKFINLNIVNFKKKMFF